MTSSNELLWGHAIDNEDYEAAKQYAQTTDTTPNMQAVGTAGHIAVLVESGISYDDAVERAESVLADFSED